MKQELKKQVAFVVQFSLCGALVGIVLGLWDGISNFAQFEQHLHTVGAQIRCVGYLASIHAVSFALLGGIVGMGFLVIYKWTGLNEARHWSPLYAISLGICSILAWYITVQIFPWQLLWTDRSNGQLVVILELLVSLSLGGLWLVTVLIGARMTTKRPPPKLLGAAVLVLAFIGALLVLVGAYSQYHVLRAVQDFWALQRIAVGALFLIALWRLAPAFHRRGKTVLSLLLVIGCLVAFFLGNSVPVQKSAGQWSPLAQPIGNRIRRLGDGDGDGFSRFFGGGDCDDHSPSVFPGAIEIPNDGVDQNCIGGDGDSQVVSSLVRAPSFYPTTSLPEDFNILFVLIDTMRLQSMSAYGYRRETTPRLSTFAQNSTLFTSAWSQSSFTNQTVPSLITGRHPHAPPCQCNERPARLDKELETAGFLPLAIPIPGEQSSFQFIGNNVESVLQAIESNKDQRLFLLAYFSWPHMQYEPHKDLVDFGQSPQDHYDEEIFYSDQQMGRIFDELKKQGLHEKTIVFVTSDHGEGFGEHGNLAHGSSLYSEETNIPLLVHIPGQPKQVLKLPVGQVDIHATLLNLIRPHEKYPQIEGASFLADLLGQPSETPRWVFQQLKGARQNNQFGFVGKKCHVILTTFPVFGLESYSLRNDPAERKNIYRSQECQEDIETFTRKVDAFPAFQQRQCCSETPQVVQDTDE